MYSLLRKTVHTDATTPAEVDNTTVLQDGTKVNETHEITADAKAVDEAAAEVEQQEEVQMAVESEEAESTAQTAAELSQQQDIDEDNYIDCDSMPYPKVSPLPPRTEENVLSSEESDTSSTDSDSTNWLLPDEDQDVQDFTGPCAQCGQQCHEVADDGKRYCDGCWGPWETHEFDNTEEVLTLDAILQRIESEECRKLWEDAVDAKRLRHEEAPTEIYDDESMPYSDIDLDDDIEYAYNDMSSLPVLGPCQECGRACQDVAEDGKRYCDACWDTWKIESPVMDYLDLWTPEPCSPAVQVHEEYKPCSPVMDLWTPETAFDETTMELLADLNDVLFANGLSLDDLADQLGTGCLQELGFDSAIERAKLRRIIGYHVANEQSRFSVQA